MTVRPGSDEQLPEAKGIVDGRPAVKARAVRRLEGSGRGEGRLPLWGRRRQDDLRRARRRRRAVRGARPSAYESPSSVIARRPPVGRTRRRSPGTHGCKQGERGRVQATAGLEGGALEKPSRSRSGGPSMRLAIAAPPSGDSSMPSSTASFRFGAMSWSAMRRTMKSPNASEACDSNTRPVSSLSSAGPAGRCRQRQG